jgi:hypothetical protein
VKTELVFYSLKADKSGGSIIDFAVQSGDRLVSLHNGETLEQLRAKYVDVRLGPLGEAHREVEASFFMDPVEVSYEDYNFAFGCLPPKVLSGGGCQVFWLSELYYGDVAVFFAKAGERCFKLRALKTSTHAEIMGKVNAFITEEQQGASTPSAAKGAKQ